jgi:predicted ATP-grasp superfamily ATP-dependent carboligase
MNDTFSVLIPDGESEFAVFVAHCFASFPNARLHVLSGQRWAPFRFSRYCHTYTFRPTGPDDESRLDAIEDLVKKYQIDVLLPTETSWLSFVVANREALSSFVAVAPVPCPRDFEIANNKWLLSQFLEEHHIASPPTLLVSQDELFNQLLETLDFPVLLKPVTAWGGEGIERFEDKTSLKRYLEAQDPETVNGRFIAQSFLPGRIVGVNVLARDGDILATTMQTGIIPNTQEYAAAGAIEFIKEDSFSSMVRKLVQAVSWSGFANIDTLHDSRDDQLKILEINARFWGSLRGSLVAGVSFPYLACLAALNIPFPMPDYQLTRYFHPKTALRVGLRKIQGENRGTRIPYQETGLRFLLADPLAEAMRALNQEVLDKGTRTV